MINFLNLSHSVCHGVISGGVNNFFECNRFGILKIDKLSTDELMDDFTASSR